METQVEIESLFARIEAMSKGKGLPPVERWHPAHHGPSHMRIAVDGRWYYRDSEIQRKEMVRLFATILRRDADSHVLVTPAEKLEIAVDDAPFVVVDFESRGVGADREIAFVTNVGDVVIAGGDHPLEVESRAEGPRPYVHVRARLRALISRSTYYRLVQVADWRDEVGGVWSQGVFFPLSR